MRYQPGDVVAETRSGCTIRYNPSMGSGARYVIRCTHGTRITSRSLREARHTASHPEHWCDECSRLV